MTDKEKEDRVNLRKTLTEKYKLAIIKKEYQSVLDQNIIPKELILDLKSRQDASEEDVINMKEKLNSASRRLTQENINVCEKNILELQLCIEGQCETLRKKLGKERCTTVFTSIKNDVVASITQHALRKYKRSCSTKDTVTQDNISSKESIFTHTIENIIDDGDSKEVLIEIDGDGHCFFSCIALHLNEKYKDNEEKKGKGKKVFDFSDIRKLLADELISNIHIYQKYVDGDFQTHVNNINLLNGSVATWATEAEIFAAANRFNVDIFVKEYRNGKFEWSRFPPDKYKHSKCNHPKEFICLNLSSSHFDVIKRDQRPCKCT